ncbi:MAG: hypothetical protein ABJL35_15020, partial [Parasphingorhabdus sp.]|uniref:hypothetical protein n=1 Tax=Parasphingorhabdus sp. TaxID=2709688 RepID=UPI00329A451C
VFRLPEFGNIIILLYNCRSQHFILLDVSTIINNTTWHVYEETEQQHTQSAGSQGTSRSHAST